MGPLYILDRARALRAARLPPASPLARPCQAVPAHASVQPDLLSSASAGTQLCTGARQGLISAIDSPIARLVQHQLLIVCTVPHCQRMPCLCTRRASFGLMREHVDGGAKALPAGGRLQALKTSLSQHVSASPGATQLLTAGSLQVLILTFWPVKDGCSCQTCMYSQPRLAHSSTVYQISLGDA